MMDIITKGLDDDRKYLKKLLKARLQPKMLQKLQDWAKEHQMVVDGAQRGPIKETTPYLTEIQDALNPDWLVPERESVNIIAFMKPAQVGASLALIDAFILWIIAQNQGPTNIFFGNLDLMKFMFKRRIDPAISAHGLRSFVKKWTKEKQHKETGDNAYYKELANGYIRGVSPDSSGSFRGLPVKFQFFDEFEVGSDVLSGEGSLLELALARATEFSPNHKIFFQSTPTEEESSNIYPMFLMGDQRYYFVPCPQCGLMQRLLFSKERFVFKRDDDGRYIAGSARYKCVNEECGALWRNEDKAIFLPKGEWRATATAQMANMRSYSLNGLYAGLGLLHWDDIAVRWINANKALEKGDVNVLQAFINTVLGEPFKVASEKPNWERIALLKRDEPFTGLDRIKFYTLGADVQGDRIEYEIVGWGEHRENWSITYDVLVGDVTESNSDIWQRLREIILRPIGDQYIEAAFIDSGYETKTVYEFCQGFASGVYPSDGQESLVDGRMLKEVNVDGFNITKININNYYFKSEVYRTVPLQKHQNGTTPHGFAHYPSDRPSIYFKSLFAEEHKVKRVGATYKRYYQNKEGNEALDIRVANLAALYYIALKTCHGYTGQKAIDWPLFWQVKNQSLF